MFCGILFCGYLKSIPSYYTGCPIHFIQFYTGHPVITENMSKMNKLLLGEFHQIARVQYLFFLLILILI
jgi:hypothetical protein